MLHEGSPGIKKSASACNLDFFSLVAIPKNSYALHSTISCEISKSANGKTLYSIGINIRSLCEIMMIVAREYYHKHAQDFHFNCEIVDLNEYYAKR